MTDSLLMQRYVAGHDSLAFGDLVARHGPAVLRTCRRFVHDPHEAEDAMQATFLILVQRAPSIRDPEQIDRWLTGVARRVAVRARQRSAHRSEHERRWAESHREESFAAEKPLEIEMRRAVREELGQLPDADRTPLTLCYVDGLTHEEAARRLGCPIGTIKARLVRARRRLRDRLDRRGVALSLGLLLLLLRPETASAGEFAAAAATVEAMSWAATGDFEAVRARYPDAWDLVRTTTLPMAKYVRISALSLVVGLVAIVLLGGTVVWSAASREEARKVSARLAKVLEVNCGINP